MKRFIYAFFIAGFAISATAQCTGFLILKEQKIFSDEDGKEEIQKNRKSFLIGIPDASSAWALTGIVKVEEGTFGVTS